MNYNAILGLDPGRDKIGFALVTVTGDLYCSGAVKSANWPYFLDILEHGNRQEFQVQEMQDGILIDVYKIEKILPWLLERPAEELSLNLKFIALGNGTCSKSLEKDLRARNLSCQISVIDEHGTTLEARELYWRLHRPSFFKRLLPRVLWGIPRPLDDLAAWAIARRSLSSLDR